MLGFQVTEVQRSLFWGALNAILATLVERAFKHLLSIRSAHNDLYHSACAVAVAQYYTYIPYPLSKHASCVRSPQLCPTTTGNTDEVNKLACPPTMPDQYWGEDEYHC